MIKFIIVFLLFILLLLYISSGIKTIVLTFNYANHTQPDKKTEDKKSRKKQIEAESSTDQSKYLDRPFTEQIANTESTPMNPEEPLLICCSQYKNSL